MTINEFLEDPFGKKAVHAAYGDSYLHMRPAPEYASGEVVLASLQRNVGFGKSLEGDIPSNGRQLLQRIAKRKRIGMGVGLSVDSWQSILEAPLRSPKQPNQSTKRFLQLCPLVPDCSLYSSSARLSTNSWNPGQMVERIISFGFSQPEHGAGLWKQLFESLTVTDADDDPWAKALHREFDAWRPPGIAWNMQSYDHYAVVDSWHVGGGSSPAARFVADLAALLPLKTALTRRQWASMLESLLRLGTSSHVLWLCKANRECFSLFRRAMQGVPVPSLEEIAQERLAVGVDGFWRYGQRAAETIRDHARDFVMARAAINLLLVLLAELGWGEDRGLPKAPLASPATIRDTAIALYRGRADFPLQRFDDLVRQVVDREPRILAAKKGIGSNIGEFLRHCLGQRQTSEEGMKSYDQGFWLRKRGYHASSPWIVSAGPVAVLVLVFCCSRRKVGPATVDDLCRHLREYGISVKPTEVPMGDLGSTLRNMGLVTDSPDAEGGMLIRNPFELDLGDNR